MLDLATQEDLERLEKQIDAKVKSIVTEEEKIRGKAYEEGDQDYDDFIDRSGAIGPAFSDFDDELVKISNVGQHATARSAIRAVSDSIDKMTDLRGVASVLEQGTRWVAKRRTDILGGRR